jgi:hypothetical protein
MYGKKIKVKGKNPLMSKMAGGPRGRSISKTVAPMSRIASAGGGGKGTQSPRG